jgi:DNA invertase Pin-like site-specific DNA recombinase
MACKGKQVEAVAYIRTSSATNVGADKDSEPRQRRAIEGYAKRAGYALVDEFSDQAVKGTDPIEARPGFSALLDRIEGNGVRTVIVEDASRFALIVLQFGKSMSPFGESATDSFERRTQMIRNVGLRKQKHKRVWTFRVVRQVMPNA